MSENFLNDPVKVLQLDDEPDILMRTKSGKEKSYYIDILSSESMEKDLD